MENNNTENKIPTISKQDFTNSIKDGMTYPQLVDKYKISIGNVKMITKDLGLQKDVRRNVVPKYILQD